MKITKISNIFNKATDLNYGGMLQKLLQQSRAGATRRQKTGRHAVLTGSDLAFLPGGASTEEGVRLAAFKHSVSVIKNMKVADMKIAMEGYEQHFGKEKTGPYLTARLLLVAAFEAGFGILPRSWVSSKDKADVRTNIAKEGALFTVDTILDVSKRALALKIIDYWGAEAERGREKEGGGALAEAPRDNVLTARASLHALFGEATGGAEGPTASVSASDSRAPVGGAEDEYQEGSQPKRQRVAGE